MYPDEPLGPHDSSLWVDGAVEDVDADDVGRVLVGVLAEEDRGDLAEVVLYQLREGPDEGHRAGGCDLRAGRDEDVFCFFTLSCDHSGMTK